MKKCWQSLIAIVLTTIIVIVGMAGTAHASSSTTPKSLRGTWYEYSKYDHSYGVTVINKHSVLIYNLSKHNHISYRRVFKTSNQGYHKMRVYKYRRGYGGTVYQLNKGQDDAHTLPLMWIGHRTVHGKRYRVLKQYMNMGVFHVALKHKMPHTGTYQYHGQNYMHQIGR